MLDLYTASAGSGKTYTLTLEYLRLLFQDKDHAYATDVRKAHGRILAVTFTKKATAEMKHRIVTALSELANPKGDPSLRASFLNDASLHLTQEQLQTRARQLLVDILQDYTHLSISTIDAFFQQIVRSFAIDMNLPFSYEISLDEAEIIEQAVDSLFMRIRKDIPDDWAVNDWITQFAQQNITDQKGWNPKESINGFSKQLMKEKLMRHMERIQSFFADKQQLKAYLTTLQQIEKEAQDRTGALCQEVLDNVADCEGMNQIIIKVFKKSAIKLLEYGGIPKTALGLLDQPEAICIGKVKAIQREQYTRLCEQYIIPAIQEIQQLSLNYQTAKVISKNLYKLGLLQDVARYIRQANQEQSRVPISDISRLIHAIVDGQDAPFIYERVGQRFHHYMIDEFQDTSALQWDNLRPLIEESMAHGKRNLIVGDIKQSIYRWRNSEWRLLRDIQMTLNEVTTHPMKDNWRTAELVVQSNEELIMRYANWVEKTLSSDKEMYCPSLVEDIQTIYSQSSVHQVAKQSLPGVFHLQFFERSDDSTPKQKAMDSVHDIIAQVLKDGFGVGQIALLVRNRSDVMEWTQWLLELGYRVQSAEGLLVSAHPAVQLIIDLIQLPYVSDDLIIRQHIERLHPLSEDDQTKIEEARNQPLYEQVKQMIAILHLERDVEAQPYLTCLLDHIYEFCVQRVADARKFLEWWERHKNEFTIPAPDDASAIHIMTIHKSKGLEFPVVILPWLGWEVGFANKPGNQNTILWCEPTASPFDKAPMVAVEANKQLMATCFKDDYLQEVQSQYIDNLNLTYVAITRAVNRIYAFGEPYTTTQKGEISISSVGHLLSYLYRDELDEHQTYHIQSEGDIRCLPQQPPAEDNDIILEPCYAHEPIGNRLIPRSRSVDDFSPDSSDYQAIELGIRMHECMRRTRTFAMGQDILTQMEAEGIITDAQSAAMHEQLVRLEEIITATGHADWFSDGYVIEAEHDILTPTGNTYRPDRVMLDGKRAIIIDYKFGQEHRYVYWDQVRQYMQLLGQMGYDTEGWIIYAALGKIEQVV